ncbi:MAG TPA: hypothetical protein VFZ09_06965 [Archangium sp.]|uniref:hypothetical protein n=1 Tax=Archangium sp. TaxID=1872627 RepID=UPI002E345197|nr:hypothetical protein [Archangium sp.]HEX5745966.1 hypothetical protein [Archangium sp.]
MDKRTRAWSIVALGLLCAVLAYVLLRTPPKVGHSHDTPREHQAASTPAAHPPSTEPKFDPNMYRGWPLFLGWPLPEVPPPDWGTGGSAPPPPPPHRPPDQQ